MPPPYAFTTLSRLQSRLSAGGVNLRIDDDPTSVADCISDATQEIIGYVGLLYTHDSLATSSWIELKARDIAAWFLCTRRNNPAPHQIQERYEKAIADLEKVQRGEWMLSDAAQRKANVPVLTNQRAASWPVNRVVNVDGKSTGRAEGYNNHTDNTDGFDYSV